MRPVLAVFSFRRRLSFAFGGLRGDLPPKPPEFSASKFMRVFNGLLTQLKLGARVSKIHDRISITHALVFIIFSGCATLESLAIFTAIRRASPRESSFNAERQPGSFSK